MIVHSGFDQRSMRWLELHIGRVTASELDNLFTPDMEPRKGETPKTFLHKKAAEVFAGKPLIHLQGKDSNASWAMEQGVILEEEAIPAIELEWNRDIKRVPFIEHASGLAGCSPDGICVGKDGNFEFGLEIKCPQAHVHTGYLLGGVVPKEYRAQIHHSLYVTGLPLWKFISYRRKFPMLVIEVARDEGICARIHEIVGEFHVKLNDTVNYLKSL